MKNLSTFSEGNENTPKHNQNSNPQLPQKSPLQKTTRAAVLSSLLLATSCSSIVEVEDTTSTSVGGGMNVGGNGSQGGAGGSQEGFFKITHLENELITVSIDQDEVKCLNLEIENGLPYDVDIKNPIVLLSETGEITLGGGLLDSTQDPPVPNFTLLKLSKVNSAQNLEGTIHGPSELFSNNSDIAQTLELSGLGTILQGETIQVSVVLNIQNNQAMIGDKIRCSLENINNSLHLVQSGTSTPVSQSDINIPPNTSIIGNEIEITSQCIKAETASLPQYQLVPAGSNNINFACWDFTNQCSNAQTLDRLRLHRYGAGSVNDFIGLRLYGGSTAFSDLEVLNSATEEVFFSNFHYYISKGQTITVCLHADVSSSAMPGNLNGFEIVQSDHLYFVDQVFGQQNTAVDGNFPVQGPLMIIN